MLSTNAWSSHPNAPLHLRADCFTNFVHNSRFGGSCSCSLYLHTFRGQAARSDWFLPNGWAGQASPPTAGQASPPTAGQAFRAILVSTYQRNSAMFAITDCGNLSFWAKAMLQVYLSLYWSTPTNMIWSLRIQLV